MYISNEVFELAYKKLNAKQKEAVDAIDGPVMVIAGPGTGKTTILALRIANILKITDTPPNAILAITYTDTGVKAMRKKLKSFIGDRAHDIRIHTFHSFASSIISEYPDHFLHIADRKQITDIEQESIIRNIILHEDFSILRPSGRPDVYVSSIIKSIDQAKREAFSPEMVKQYAEDEIKRIEGDESSISTRGKTKGLIKGEMREEIEKCKKTILFSNIYKIYEEKKAELKKMDFNDLIIELLASFRNDELLLRLIQERYLYIHIDEHQDTNDSQNYIISFIAEFFENPNIFIVGDEKQAIYRFQGASVENFLLFQKNWPSMKVISLDMNYRSHQKILDGSFSMIEKNYNKDEYSDLRIRLISQGKTEIEPIDIVSGENTQATEKYIINKLKNIKKDETVAIIVRRNRDLNRIIRLLEYHNIPVSSERSADIFSHPLGILFFDLIEYIMDASRTDLLAKTIVSGMWNISFADSITILKELKSGINKNIEDKIKNIKEIRKNILSDSPIAFFIHIAEKSGFTSLITDNVSNIHVWRGIIDLAESLVKENNIHNSVKLIESMLEYRLSAEYRNVKVSHGVPDFHIQAMTAHGSKGLEFDYVFIPYAVEESWLTRPKGASFVLPKKQIINSDTKDTRRLFYVALTRARKKVTILYSLEESLGKTLTPLRFIDEIDKEHIFNISLNRVNVEEVYKKDNTSSSISSPIIDLTKKTLMESGLSVTALNHFIKCPNEFIYKSILKLPQAPSISGEKGTAMHEAISKVWRSANKDFESIKYILNESVTAYFDKSFLSIKDKDLAMKDLLESNPIVAKDLHSHFISPINSIIFTESWVKTDFETIYNKESIVIPIHGKLDAIVDSDNDVRVFDYKTKESMSINAIRGETKSDSNGDYFRQLIFYKILLLGDTRFRNKKITSSLVFISPDNKGRCPIISLDIEDKDIERVKKEISSLVESVWSGEIANKKCDDMDCEWCGLRSVAILK